MKNLKKRTEKLFRVSYSVGFVSPTYFETEVNAICVKNAEKIVNNMLNLRYPDSSEICDITEIAKVEDHD